MVEGLAKLNQRWSKIPKAVRINVKAAMQDAADDIVQEMWYRAPRGATGVVAASIGWTWGDAPKGAYTVGTVGGSEPTVGNVGGREYGTQRITIYMGGGDAFYARMHEFGTVKMPSRPFFFPVWRARRKKIKSKISRAMNKAIKESR